MKNHEDPLSAGLVRRQDEAQSLLEGVKLVISEDGGKNVPKRHDAVKDDVKNDVIFYLFLSGFLGRKLERKKGGHVKSRICHARPCLMHHVPSRTQ